LRRGANPKRTSDFQDGVKAGLRAGRQRFVQTFPARPRILCNLCHTPGAGNIRQRQKQKVRVVRFKHGGNVFGYRNVIGKVAGCVERDQFDGLLAVLMAKAPFG